MNRKTVISGGLILFLAGCQTQPPIDWNNPSVTESRVSVTHDDFDKTTRVSGPYLEIGAGYRDGNEIFLRAWKRRSGYEHFQIYIIRHYIAKDPYSFSYAYDSNGNRFDVAKIDFDVLYIISDLEIKYSEDFGIDVSRDYLESSFKTGISLKLYGRKHSEIISIPGGYVQGFMSKFDQVN